MNVCTGRNSIGTGRLNDALSQSRTYMMGIAMLSIMLFHNTFGVLGFFSYIFTICGFWGVDIFLFLSGFGLFFACSRGKSLKYFYSRRLLRIMPASILAGSFLFLLGKSFLLAVLGLNLWYIRTILILYLLAPGVYHMLIKWSPSKTLFVWVAISIAGLMIGIPLMVDSGFLWQSTVTWTLSRLPVFVFGMYIASVDWDIKKILNWKYLLVFFIILISLLLVRIMIVMQCISSYTTYFNLFLRVVLASLVPMFCLFLYFIHNRTTKFIRKGIELFGVYSLEIYLVHEAVFEEVIILKLSDTVKFFIAYGASVILALLLHWFVNSLLSLRKIPRCFSSNKGGVRLR